MTTKCDQMRHPYVRAREGCLMQPRRPGQPTSLLDLTLLVDRFGQACQMQPNATPLARARMASRARIKYPAQPVNVVVRRDIGTGRDIQGTRCPGVRGARQTGSRARTRTLRR